MGLQLVCGQLEACQQIREGKASLGEKPLKEEEAPAGSFKDIIVDKHNKEDFQTDTIRLVLSLIVLGSMLL